MKCPHCGNTSPFSTGTFCVHCGALLHTQKTVDSTIPSEEAVMFEPEIAWESSMRSSAPLKALYTTFMAVIFHPNRFYQSLTTSASPLFPSIWYGLICGSIGMVGSWLWAEVLVKYGQSAGGFTSLFGSMSISTSSLLSAPIMILCQFCIMALYTQFIMRFGGGKKPPLSHIIRVLCYAESTSLLFCIPFVGYGVAIIAGIYSILTGFHYLFGLSRKKIFFTLILPLFIIIGCIVCIVVAGILGGAIAGAGVLQQWLSLIR